MVASAIISAVYMSACTSAGNANNKTYNELKIYCSYKNENVDFVLPIKHKRRDFGGSYAKLKSTSDKQTLYEKLKEESAFIEEHNDSLLFLANGESCNYPQYVAIFYEGVNEDNSKYYNYTVSQQQAGIFSENGNIEFSFPTYYVNQPDNYKFLSFGVDVNSVNVDCTFEQLKTYYTRLEYAFVSATENSITIKGAAKYTSQSGYSDVLLILEYENGTVAVSLAE